MRSDGVEAILLDMGGVLVPEIPGYANAARDASLLQRLKEVGIQEPERLIVEGSQRLRDAYIALEPQGTQPDLDLVFAELAPPVRELVLDAFRREAAQPAHDSNRSSIGRENTRGSKRRVSAISASVMVSMRDIVR